MDQRSFSFLSVVLPVFVGDDHPQVGESRLPDAH